LPLDRPARTKSSQNAPQPGPRLANSRPRHRRKGGRKKEFSQGRKNGRALIAAAEDYSRGKGSEYLMVKTLGPSRPNKDYESTRLFYEARGFRPLQEFNSIWQGIPCLIMVKSLRCAD
jgi:hypothetical protein